MESGYKFFSSLAVFQLHLWNKYILVILALQDANIEFNCNSMFKSSDFYFRLKDGTEALYFASHKKTQKGGLCGIGLGNRSIKNYQSNSPVLGGIVWYLNKPN
ncbi:hypothetical protein [Desertivirga arenae]|uniref:hypothetical protein n=1 Tax=Desertivirga arenae TaxID=2810309 RepID=UPI001A9574EF|nr:hypothetical protein [Pedobacter sp. SYSU D00823]